MEGIVTVKASLNPVSVQGPGHVHVAAAKDAVAASSPITATKPET